MADGAFAAVIVVYGDGNLEALLAGQLLSSFSQDDLENSQERNIQYKAFGNPKKRLCIFLEVHSESELPRMFICFVIHVLCC